jgi:hypothetical protein
MFHQQPGIHLLFLVTQKNSTYQRSQSQQFLQALRPARLLCDQGNEQGTCPQSATATRHFVLSLEAATMKCMVVLVAHAVLARGAMAALEATPLVSSCLPYRVAVTQNGSLFLYGAML